MIMIYKFEELQVSTLKTLTQRQDLIAEIDRKSKENKAELQNLVEREEKELNDLDKILFEMKGCSKLTNTLLKQTGEENINDYLIGLVMNLLTHVETLMPEHKKKRSRFTEVNPLKDLINILKVYFV
jgi:hypothetical protein